MTDRIIKALGALLPGVEISRSGVVRRSEAITVRTMPLASARFRRSERVTLGFYAPSFARVREMYLTVRRSLVSDGNESRLGEGNDMLIIHEENAPSDAAFLPKCALYRLSASFTVTGR